VQQLAELLEQHKEQPSIAQYLEEQRISFQELSHLLEKTTCHRDSSEPSAESVTGGQSCEFVPEEMPYSSVTWFDKESYTTVDSTTRLQEDEAVPQIPAYPSPASTTQHSLSRLELNTPGVAREIDKLHRVVYGLRVGNAEPLGTGRDPLDISAFDCRVGVAPLGAF
jgi:hypothetical protein